MAAALAVATDETVEEGEDDEDEDEATGTRMQALAVLETVRTSVL
jgi:hypothetical protein